MSTCGRRNNSSDAAQLNIEHVYIGSPRYGFRVFTRASYSLAVESF